ncbi:MAG TPA: hypothetical protein VK787_05700 [Puia sp.]|nr:hypothetical protein [Puia sp.]
MNLFTSMLLIVSFFSCNQISSQNDFLTGIYVREISGEYSNGNDTLRIEKLNESGISYVIYHSSSFQRILNGIQQKQEYKSEKWIAIYDEEHKILHEQKFGKIFSFITEKNELLAGASKYKKIK